MSHTDHQIEVAISRYQTWLADQERFGFYPGSVALVATEDPQGCWAVEVSQRLFEKSFKVW
ncbi:MAG: hypothetical protein NW237_16535 [Cyanobacteriota bacterium]|nr:hypothetical protein [Cyanobacteriota bacterium]